MEPIEPAGRLSAGLRSIRWGATVLVALILTLFVLSYAQNRSAPAVERSDLSGLFLDNLLVARQVYAILHSNSPRLKTLEGLTARLIAGEREAAISDPSPASIRRLALCYYMVRDPRWKSALLRLTTLPAQRPAMNVERELALWNAVLDGFPTPEQVQEFVAAVREMDLGWYSHIALEAAYARAGRQLEAQEEARQANRSSGRLVGLKLAETIAGLTGAGLWLFLAGRYLANRQQYRPPITAIDRLLTPRAPWPLISDQRSLLYYVFISYLASVALLRLATGIPGLGAFLGSVAQSSPVGAVLLSIALTALPVTVPFILFLRVARPAFVDWRAIGFCTTSWKHDALFGIAGYMAAIPLVYGARIVSETLFRGIETPANPAVTAFAGTESALFQILVFIQAAMLAPLIEEALFRGVFFQSIEHRLGTWKSALLVSGVFAVLHPQLPLGFLGIFALGVVFNMLFAMRRSLLPCIVAHGINNAVILLFLLTLTRG